MRALLEQIEELDGNEVYGRVVGVRGLMVEVAGPLHTMSVGARVVIETQGTPIPCGFSGHSTGEAISASSSGIFVAGEGGPMGTFGKVTTSNDGLFVAKLK